MNRWRNHSPSSSTYRPDFEEMTKNRSSSILILPGGSIGLLKATAMIKTDGAHGGSFQMTYLFFFACLKNLLVLCCYCCCCFPSLIFIFVFFLNLKKLGLPPETPTTCRAALLKRKTPRTFKRYECFEYKIKLVFDGRGGNTASFDSMRPVLNSF